MSFVEQNIIRTMFSRAMSDMYKKEVPQYQALLKLAAEVNQQTLEADPHLYHSLNEANELQRINEERHGAIRLGKAEELAMIRRLFAVMGMHPVGYYDLSVAAMPVHSTAFRPIKDTDLKKNPFRIFTSLLRTELIENTKIRQMAEEILASRDIFTAHVRELIDIHEINGGLDHDEAQEFVREALATFHWHQQATISFENYVLLTKVHPLVADVVSFKGPHINHLTPRTLDINAVQNIMPSKGLNPKAVIEGPPERKIPILLRQTSFKALEESISFPSNNNNYQEEQHKARFGEIEQRGAALTPKGKNLYEQKIAIVRNNIIPNLDGSNADEYYAVLKQEFADFPDDIALMRQQGLVYVEYGATKEGIKKAGSLSGEELNTLIAKGYIEYSPITYEDFLPVSAAGIFTSNLGENCPQIIVAEANQEAFEDALGTKTLDPFALYEAKQVNSLKMALEQLGISN